MFAFLRHAYFLSRRAGALSLPILLLAAPRCQGQARPNSPAPAAIGATKPSTTTLLNTNAAEVSLDLVVRTKRHQPVSNLQPGELEVTDDGTPVQITSLRLVNPAAGTQHLVTLVFDRLDSSAAKSARRMAEKILGGFLRAGTPSPCSRQTGGCGCCSRGRRTGGR